MRGAAEFFAKNNYYVFRMGKNQSEKLKSYDYKNRIIDYAFSNKKSDFLDIFYFQIVIFILEETQE